MRLETQLRKGNVGCVQAKWSDDLAEVSSRSWTGESENGLECLAMRDERPGGPLQMSSIGLQQADNDMNCVACMILIPF